MNSIQSLQSQFIQQNNSTGSLRKAALKPEIPQLSQDESTHINRNFEAGKSIDIYSSTGNVTRHQVAKGHNIDTRI